MAEALRMLVGGPSSLYVVGFGLASIAAIVFVDYSRYVTV